MRCRRCAAATRARPSVRTPERTGLSSAIGSKRCAARWSPTSGRRVTRGSVMLVQRRIGVANLNGRAHALMCAAGALGEQEVVGGDVTFDRGNRVLVRRNDRGLGVVDGDRGVVTKVDPELRRIDVDLGGRRVRCRAPSSSSRRGTAAAR